MSPTPRQLEPQQDANQSHAPSLIASIVVGLILAYSSIVLRYVARRKSHLKLAADDWIIIASSVFLIPFTVAQSVIITKGFGKHSIYYTGSKPQAAIVQQVSLTSYGITNTLTKISILMFYCSLFNSKNLVKLTWVLSIFTVAYNLVANLVSAFKCIPFTTYSDDLKPKCFDETVPRLILGIVNVVTDVVILAIPIRFVIALKMSMIRKIQLSGVFMTGALVCAFSIARCVALSVFDHDDPSYYSSWANVWTVLESAIGIVAACLPIMKVFFSETSFSDTAKRMFNVTATRNRWSTSTAGEAINLQEGLWKTDQSRVQTCDLSLEEHSASSASSDTLRALRPNGNLRDEHMSATCYKISEA